MDLKNLPFIDADQKLPLQFLYFLLVLETWGHFSWIANGHKGPNLHWFFSFSFRVMDTMAHGMAAFTLEHTCYGHLLMLVWHIAKYTIGGAELRGKMWLLDYVDAAVYASSVWLYVPWRSTPLWAGSIVYACLKLTNNTY